MIQVDLDQSYSPTSCGRPMIGSPDVVVDLSSHNANPPSVFDGEAVPLPDVADSRVDEAVVALREFVHDHGRPPTAESWTNASMQPSERTVRRLFGSFRSAILRAGITSPGSSSLSANESQATAIPVTRARPTTRRRILDPAPRGIGPEKANHAAPAEMWSD